METQWKEDPSHLPSIDVDYAVLSKGWLIRNREMPPETYLLLEENNYDALGIWTGWEWTHDMNKAVRMCRKEDAEVVAKYVLGPSHKHEFVEHEFVEHEFCELVTSNDP